MANEVRINGNALSWASVICRVNGEVQHWITEITYADKRERTHVYGAGRHQGPRGRTSGKYTVENTALKGPRGDVQGFLAALAAQSQDGSSYGDAVFSIDLQFIEDEIAVHVEIEDCVIVGVSSSSAEGAEALIDELELQPMRITRNGLTLFTNSQA